MSFAQYSDSKTIVTTSDQPRPTSIRHVENCLVEIYGSNLGKRYIITSEAMIIGRDDSCQIHIPRDNISRYHAKLTMKPNECCDLEDLDSTNGTFVNDVRLTGKCMLKNGDLVRIGATVFKYISGSNIEAGYYEEIYRMTIIDGLTGIYNKRYFMESLIREMGRSKRYERPLALIMLDIHHFKKVKSFKK